MNSELVDVGENVLPSFLRSALADAQSRIRYRWVAPHCTGRDVLEIGSGSGGGCLILLEEGARRVVGVDQAQAVIDAAAATMPQGVRLMHTTADRLPLDDRAVQTIVWFDPLPYVGHFAPLLDEVHRVLAPDGLFILGWPNREITLHGGPEDRQAFYPGHLLSAVRERFADVQLFRQTDWTASAIFDDQMFASGDVGALRGVTVSKLVESRPGTEAYTLAIATVDADDHVSTHLPPALVMLAGVGDASDWLQRFEKQQAVIREHLDRLSALEQIREERDELRRQLRHNEQACAETVNRMTQELQRDLALLTQSTSWRLTAPLRKVSAMARMPKRLLRRLRSH